jgi:hypothetical protein
MDSQRQAEYDYDALPQRLVIVDTDGRIALDVGRGVPAGLNLAPVEAWLNTHARASRVQGSALRDQESAQGDNLIPRAAPSTIGR